jgi:hypothetical protein
MNLTDLARLAACDWMMLTDGDYHDGDTYDVGEVEFTAVDPDGSDDDRHEFATAFAATVAARVAEDKSYEAEYVRRIYEEGPDAEDQKLIDDFNADDMRSST